MQADRSGIFVIVKFIDLQSLRLHKIKLCHFTDEVDHFDGTFRTVGTFVSCLCAGTFDGLFDVLCSNDAEHYRNACREGNLSDAFGNLIADVVVVAGSSADHCTQTDHGIVLAAFSHLGGDERDLKRTRDPCYMDVLFFYVVTFQRVQSTGEELGCNKLVETCCNNADSYFFRY